MATESPQPDPQVAYKTEFTPPANAVDVPRWLVWKYAEDKDGNPNRKVPRAPWNNPNPEHFASAHDPENWLPYDEMQEMRRMFAGFGFEPAFCIPPDDREYELEGDEAELTDLLLFDFDDVINADGELLPKARHYVSHIDSYAQISTSKTGVHIIVRGELPEDVKTITGDLSKEGWPDAELEVYAAGRYIAMTGWRIENSSMFIKGVDDAVLDHLVEKYDTNDNESGSNDRDIENTRDDLEEIETTTDINAVYDAIDQMRVGDIQLRSEVTRNRDGTYYDLDPSWASSDSGTRLMLKADAGADKFVYRKGMIGLSLFQIVALEEGIVASEADYPEGKAFWETVEACRKRGAHIPEFVDDEPSSKYDDVPDEAIERESTSAIRVLSAAMHRATTDDVSLDLDGERFRKIGDRTFYDRDTGETLSLIDAVAYDEGIIDDPDEKIDGRADWIKVGHTMRWRGATVPEYKSNGGCAGSTTPKGWK